MTGADNDMADTKKTGLKSENTINNKYQTFRIL